MKAYLKETWDIWLWIIAVLALVWLFSWARDAQAHPVEPKPAAAVIDPLACGPTYQSLYFEAGMAYLPNDLKPYWCWLSAQGKAESAYNPDAVSPAKAQGVAQFMEATWREVCAPKFGRVSPYALGPAIRCQAYYMARLSRFWVWDRPATSRLRLATACYNAGCGSVHRAQKKCMGARHWKEIQPCLREVTGRHSEETTQYVVRIEGFYRQFTGEEVPLP